jgi:hypothetical protein
MVDPENMIIPLLREMRAETSAGFAAVDARFAAVEMRLNKVDATLTTFRHALGGDSLLGRILTSEFEERIEALERKVRDLETTK